MNSGRNGANLAVKDWPLSVPVRIAAPVLLFLLPRLLQGAPAFPGALGFGANATGGRSGSVYHVTTLADSGPGSFRTAVGSANRIVVFDVGGYISLVTAVSVKNNITIAGQTAPGGGIGFKGGEISFANSSNIICRYIRIRPGSDTASINDDALSFYRAQNIICDHVSLEFAPWNNIDGVSDDWQNYPVTDITVQNSIIANPTYQQFGAHTESVSSRWSWFYNVWANSHNRNPLAKINTVFINNVLYNYQAGYTTHTSTPFKHDIVNNYFIFGPATTSDDTWFQIDSNQSIYYSGNLKDSDEDGALSGAETTPYWYQGPGTILTSPWSSITTTIPTFSPNGAFRYAVSASGALPRDPMDDLVLSQVKTLGNGPTGTGAGTTGPGGGLYTSQTQTGLPNNGYGTINGGAAALDTDGDGMPDYWEQANGSNIGSNDAMALDADGYAKIEKYLNWLADPHALTTTNSPVVVDLWQYTSGFTNASPVYFVGNATNGTIALSNGHVAVFTPNPNSFGMAAFQFSVSVVDGSAYTNKVSVVVSAQQTPSNLIWRGDGNANVWSTTASNWVNQGGIVPFKAGDNVTFDDSGSNSPAINLSEPIAAGTVSLVSAQDYTFTGSPIIGGASLFKVGTGKLTLLNLNTFSGGTTINEGIVQLGDGVSVNGNLNGNVTNNDELVFANPSALSSSASISGSGTLTKSGLGILTLSGNQTYTNFTTINTGTVELSGTPPQGLITNNGTLVFKPTTTVTCPGTIGGNGDVVISNNSATVYLTGTNSYVGGTTNLGGTVIFTTSTAAGTGPVTYNAGSGSVMVGGGAVITNDFSVGGTSFTDLMMQATNGIGVWAGNIVNLGSSAQWRPGADTGGTLVFTGTANLGTRNFIVPRGSVQFASNAIVSATGSAVAFGRDTGGNNRSANVTIKDNATMNLGVCSLGGGQAGGSVTLTLQNNAALSCGANSFDVQNVNRTTATTTIRLNGGTFTVGGFTKTKTSQTNVINFNGGILRAGANNAAFLSAFSVATNNVQPGGAQIDDGGFTIAIAGPLLHDPTLGSTPDGGLIKSGSGTLTLAANNTYTGPTLINAGVLALYAPPLGNISNSINIYVAAGAQLDFGTGGSAAMTLGGGRLLWGNGSIKGNFTLGSGAILAPGSNSIGLLAFSNSVVFAAGSTNVFELSKSPLTNDTVKVIGNAALSGTVMVTKLAGTLAAGDTFKLIDATSYSGSFSTVVLPTLATGLAWNTNSLNTTGVITVVRSGPMFNPPVLNGGNLVLSGTNGPPGATFYLLTSTNIALPPKQWTRIATNHFDINGAFNVSNPLEPAPSQQFYRLEVP